MDTNRATDDVLFETLQKNKKKKRRKTALRVVLILLAVLIALGIGIVYLRNQVRDTMASRAQEVLSAQVTRGAISTTVSGSGTIDDVDLTEISVPAGVEVEELLVSAGDIVKTGDVLATVKMASVSSALADCQSSLEDLSDQISEAKNAYISRYVRAGVSGRVKRIFAEKDMTVLDCMAEYGALAVLSTDGYMVLSIDNASLSSGESVTVRWENTDYPGVVESAGGGLTTVLVKDDKLPYHAEVTVLDDEGTELGSGLLDIHKPLSVTAVTGTISYVNIHENRYVYAGSALFTLSGANNDAKVNALLADREEKQEELQALLQILQDGAVCAPFAGTVSSVQSDSDEAASSSGTAAGSPYAAADTDSSETVLLKLSPDEKMEVTIAVDETDILSLKLGQHCDVTVESAGSDSVAGTVTEINKAADTSSGVSAYSAVITFPKSAGMLPGMTAEVDITIEGTDGTLIVPVDAVHQTSSTYYVYTSYDEENDAYGGMATVTVGISNSKYMEIRSGLQEGDTVFYTEKQSNDFFASMGGFGPSGMGGGSSGGMGGGMRPGMGGFGG